MRLRGQAAFVGPPANSWAHRPALDGLRALAVYLVVGFHAGLPPFQGGFIGVDLFFVLSGFLITNVILQQVHETGEFSFARFYARRARRLLPAASLAIIGTAVGALLLSNPLDRVNLVPDARAASVWFANWHFIAEEGDYFSTEDAPSPFLHFWSLAIEEQFYLAFPVVALALLRIQRRWLITAAIGIALVCGIVLQLYWASANPSRAYWGTDARIYQIIAGIGLAAWLWRKPLGRQARVWSPAIVPVLLFLYLALSTDLISISVSTRGFIATALAVAILFGLEAGTGPSLRVLGSSPVTYLGQISYGTYLWHWPILVLAQRQLLLEPAAAALVSAALGTAMAALSYAIIESPVRQSLRLESSNGIAGAACVAIALVVGLVAAPTILQHDGPPQIRSAMSSAPLTPPGANQTVDLADAMVEDNFQSAPASRQEVPNLDWISIRENVRNGPHAQCENHLGSDCLVVAGAGPRVLILGDSHAQHWIPALRALAQKHGFELQMKVSFGCPWPATLVMSESAQFFDDCVDRDAVTWGGQLSSIEPDLVIAASKGGWYGQSSSVSFPSLSGPELFRVTATETIERLESLGIPILIIEPVIEVVRDPLDCLSGAQFIDECEIVPRPISPDKDIIRSLARDHSGAFSADPNQLLACSDFGGCPAMIEGVVVRRDTHHLSVEFAEANAAWLWKQMQDTGVFE